MWWWYVDREEVGRRVCLKGIANNLGPEITFGLNGDWVVSMQRKLLVFSGEDFKRSVVWDV